MTTEKGGRPIEACAFCGTRERPRGLRKRDLLLGPPVFLQVRDCREALDDVAGVDLFLTDPPYNIGFEYADDLEDSLPAPDYMALMDTVAWKSFKAAKEGGSFVLIHYHEEAAEILPLFLAAGWKLRRFRSWVYEDRRAVKHGRFPRSSRAMLWFSKGRPSTWNAPAPGWDLDWVHCDQVKGGSIGWQGYGCQVPAPILRHWIATLTNPGDLVADPFLGTASTAKEAVFLGRRTWGCDVNPAAADRWAPLQAAAAGDRYMAVDGQVPGTAEEGSGPPREPVLVEEGSGPSSETFRVQACLEGVQGSGPNGPDIQEAPQ